GTAPGRRMADERQVHDLEGRDLVRRYAKCRQLVHRAVIEWRREEADLTPGRVGRQLLLPFPRQLDPLDQVPRVLVAHSLEVGEARRVLRVERLGRVGLELHGVGAGVGGHVDQRLAHGEITVVVGSRLGDDEAGLSLAHPAVADLDSPYHLLRLTGRPITWATRTSLGGGLRPPSEPSPQEFVAPAKPALEARSPRAILS